MKNNYLFLLRLFYVRTGPRVFQPGRAPAMPTLNGHMAKLFGGISAYSATMEVQTKDGLATP